MNSTNDIDCRNCEYYLNTNPRSTDPAWCTYPPKGHIQIPQLAPMCRNFKPSIPRDKYGRPMRSEVQDDDKR